MKESCSWTSSVFSPPQAAQSQAAQHQSLALPVSFSLRNCFSKWTTPWTKSSGQGGGSGGAREQGKTSCTYVPLRQAGFTPGTTYGNLCLPYVTLTLTSGWGSLAVLRQGPAPGTSQGKRIHGDRLLKNIKMHEHRGPTPALLTGEWGTLTALQNPTRPFFKFLKMVRKTSWAFLSHPYLPPTPLWYI